MGRLMENVGNVVALHLKTAVANWLRSVLSHSKDWCAANESVAAAELVTTNIVELHLVELLLW